MIEKCIDFESIQKIYHETEKRLDNVVTSIVQLLDRKRLKISVAESCTGGLLSQKITSVSGASHVFELGVCTYSNLMKENILSVSHEILDLYGAVSSQVAESMISGLYELSKADICLSVTGFAGPEGGTENLPVGTVFLGVKYMQSSAFSVHLPLYKFGFNSREEIRNATAVCAFGIVYKLLMEGLECPKS